MNQKQNTSACSYIYVTASSASAFARRKAVLQGKQTVEEIVDQTLAVLGELDVDGLGLRSVSNISARYTGLNPKPYCFWQSSLTACTAVCCR